MSAAPIRLEPIYGLPTLHVVKDHKPVGILIPPQAPDDRWEYWGDGEWICHRFSSETEALIALGIAAEEEGREAA